MKSSCLEMANEHIRGEKKWKNNSKKANSAWNGSVSFWKTNNPFSFGIFLFSKVPEDSNDCVHQKALVRDSDLFNTNFKSHCGIFTHLYATSRSSSLKSSFILIYGLCRENNGQKVENGLLSSALCAASVTVIMELLSCGKYLQ